MPPPYGKCRTDAVFGIQSASNAPYGRFQWEAAIPIGFFHLGLIAAPFTLSRSALIVAFALYVIVGCFGVTMGFHRHFTHRSFKTSKWLSYVLAILGCLASEGGPEIWVGTHRLHHKYADKPGDPHSPAESFSWGHVVWAFFFEHNAARPLARDLSRDSGLVVIERFFWLPQLCLGLALYLIGGWSWVVWGIFVRCVIGLHSTWLVNSVAHRWGYRNFETPDNSTNNWLVALFSFGEGWHNNHHAQQRSAAHGLRWWEFDLTYSIIRLFEALGLVWDVRHPEIEHF